MRRSSFLFRRNILSQVVARHGDRAPTMNLFTSNEEFEFKKWLSRLPTSDQLNVNVFEKNVIYNHFSIVIYRLHTHIYLLFLPLSVYVYNMDIYA